MLRMRAMTAASSGALLHRVSPGSVRSRVLITGMQAYRDPVGPEPCICKTNHVSPVREGFQLTT